MSWGLSLAFWSHPDAEVWITGLCLNCVQRLTRCDCATCESYVLVLTACITQTDISVEHKDVWVDVWRSQREKVRLPQRNAFLPRHILPPVAYQVHAHVADSASWTDTVKVCGAVCRGVTGGIYILCASAPCLAGRCGDKLQAVLVGTAHHRANSHHGASDEQARRCGRVGRAGV